MIESHGAWTRETDALERSSLVYLPPANEARNARLHPDGRLEVENGTFAPGAQAPGGFTIIEADSLEAALEYAKRHRWLPGSNEVCAIKAPPGAKSLIRSQ